MTVARKPFDGQIIFVWAKLLSAFFDEGDHEFQLVRKDIC